MPICIGFGTRCDGPCGRQGCFFASSSPMRLLVTLLLLSILCLQRRSVAAKGRRGNLARREVGVRHWTRSKVGDLDGTVANMAHRGFAKATPIAIALAAVFVGLWVATILAALSAAF